MRPITNGERERIKSQVVTRIQGMSELAFKIKYFLYEPLGDPEGDPVTYEWWETGFYGDFSFNGNDATISMSGERTQAIYNFAMATGMPMQEVSKMASNGSRGYMQEYTTNTIIGASLTMPIEYIEGFYTRGGYGTYGHNRLFKFEVMPDGFMVDDTVYCSEVWVRSVNGEPMPADFPNVFDLDPNTDPSNLNVSYQGTLTFDGWQVKLRASSQRGSYSVYGYQDDVWLPTWKRGAGVVDANGVLSDRKDRKFTYMTTPTELRRLR